MKSPKITLNTIEQIFDLDEFGVDLTDEFALKEKIAQAIIDKIAARAQSGHGIGGKRLKSPYSHDYSETLEFKAAGKDRSTVTMELTGDMVASMEVENVEGNKIKIAITDDLQIKKAYNHQTGDTVPKRAWFGLTKPEFREVLAEFKSELAAAAESPGLNDFENLPGLTFLDIFGTEGDNGDL